MKTRNVFISYSHKDERWKTCLVSHLGVLEKRGLLDLWHDGRVGAGEDWKSLIDKAITEASIAILLISADFLTSQFVLEEEIPRLLARREKEGLSIIPIIVRDCPWRQVKWMAAMQTRPNDGIALSRKRRPQQETEFTKIAEEINSILKGHDEDNPPIAHQPFIVNSPPLPVPNYFQGRQDEARMIDEFLAGDTKHLLLVLGRGGSGKTAVACRSLDSIQREPLHDRKDRLQVDAIIYLNSTSHCKVSWPRFFSDACQVLSEDERDNLEGYFRQPGITATAKTQALLTALKDRRIIVLLDHFDDILDRATGEILDPELAEALLAILEEPCHRVKAILTSQIAPKNMTSVQGTGSIHLGNGLPVPYAEALMREMDKHRKLLSSAPESLLSEACERTLGNPRALEILYAMLEFDRDTSLEELLRELLPEKVLHELVGQAFERLDPTFQKVMQALAVYPGPVTPQAVNHLLQPYIPTLSSQPVLGRLVNMHLVRKHCGEYYLESVDRSYVLSTIPGGTIRDRENADPPFTLFALLHRGGEYFKQLGTPSGGWKSVNDLAPQLAEFSLRCQGQDYETAARLLSNIDQHLFEWGHYHQVVEFHEKLRGRVKVGRWNRHQFDILGRVHERLGQLGNAIACYQEGLRYVQQAGDSQGESLWLSNLAICHEESGALDMAIVHCRLSLDLAKKLGDLQRQAHVLNTLSDCCAQIGDIAGAISYCEQSHAIARQCTRRDLESLALANMGQHYGELGKIDDAENRCQRALAISQEFPLVESTAFRNLAELYVDKKGPRQAEEKYQQAINLADAAQCAQLQQTARTGLTLALLFSGELTRARDWIEQACRYDARGHNYEAFAVLGVVAQQQGDHRAAIDGFKKARQYADSLLGKTSKIYRPLDTKGLALSGLVLSEGSDEYIEAAKKAYQAARKVNKDAGIVRRVLRLFDELARTDSTQRLKMVREAAVGG